MITSTVQDFKNGQKYLCKDFYISCNVYGINSNSYYWEIRKEHNNDYVASGYKSSRSVALKVARDERKTIVNLYNGKVVDGRGYVFS